MGQYIPRISESDINRIVERDYGTIIRAKVSELINTYGLEKHETEVFRVRMAILKISKDLSTMEKNVAAAKRDYRDVLIAAESPKISELGFTGLVETKKAEVEERYRQDREQYLKWLTRR